jgi:drug/metabolite transporter (DMT)-like permease
VAPAHLAQIGAAVCFAGSYLCAKRLGEAASSGTVVAVLSLTVMLGLAPLAAAVWVPVGGRELVLLAAVAGFATLAHYAMMRAFAAAPLSVTQPVVFLQLVWAALTDILVFGHPVDPVVALGAAAIVAAILLLSLPSAGRVAPGPPA